MAVSLTPLDIVIFVAFIATVVTVGVLKSRHESESESYFLAGRGLTGLLIGISLIAANISTEQFVGMTGQAADYQGLAPASYDWFPAISLVIIAFFLLPYFLRAGIYTMPEFLERRYSHWARLIMAAFSVPVLVLLVACVTYSGALTLRTAFSDQKLLGILPVDLHTGSWLIGLVAAAYVASGGLKACAWADLIQGTALIVGGALITWFAFSKLAAAPIADLTPAGDAIPALAPTAGALERFTTLNAPKLHLILPRGDANLPWTALVVGLWIPNFYYWGLNQYVTQRTLGAQSLAAGQKGLVLAAWIQLILPLILIVPGMIAYNLYSKEMRTHAAADNRPSLERFETIRNMPRPPMELFDFDQSWERSRPELARAMATHNAAILARAEAEETAPGNLVHHRLIGHKFDTAFAVLIKNVLPGGWGLHGFVLAALLGAVVSSLAAMLNAASTITSLDVFKKYVFPRASERNVVFVGRFCVGVFVVIGCLLAPILGNPNYFNSSIFRNIQELQGYISPGILAVFLCGLVLRRAPASAGVAGLLANPLIYGAITFVWPEIPFLDRMAVCFFAVLALMTLIRLIRPLPVPVEFRTQTTIDLTSSRVALWAGIVVMGLAILMYILFW
ncbi:MAG: hypothetical protein JW719_09240 [Pirellulales bacterium]|nr:hypothetical protein [Pirellulales bacterium]